MDELIESVKAWAFDRKILRNSTAPAQLLKTMSELGELADAIAKGDQEETIDGIGDVLVTLIIVAALKGLEIEDCLRSAYNEIKDRRGYLSAAGVFVKEV